MNRMNESPLLSVCVQTFQHRNFIAKCLDSILCQEADFPFEIIVGEDDSTDGTRDICIQYASKYPDRIRLYLRSEKDKVFVDGVKTSRFNLISNMQEARGKYIALMDGDDYIIDPEKLKKQVRLLESDKSLSCCFHRVYIEDIRKKTVRVSGRKFYVATEPPLPEHRCVFTVKDELQRNLIQMSSVMFRRSCIDDLPGWFWKVPMMDYPLHIHNALKGDIGYLPEPMTVYVWHSDSMFSSASAFFQYKKHWQLFTTMAENTDGPLAGAILLKRHDIGNKLVHFYRTHFWEDQRWFKEELAKNAFYGDAALMTSLTRPLRAKNYLSGSYAYARDMARKVLSR